MDNNAFDGFSISLFQDDDGDWLAHFVEMPNVSAFAETPDQALVELKEAWEGIKESYRENEEAIPLPPEVKSMSST
ncbi:MAG: type II toxin-antitoxin system HicB family antitoxin [Candidatus Latescibacteria bacterium]|nr:type II toxin-antitoxin system HicB family antitoxin [Candidatus Latescibacterota bacterium]